MPDHYLGGMIKVNLVFSSIGASLVCRRLKQNGKRLSDDINELSQIIKCPVEKMSLISFLVSCAGFGGCGREGTQARQTNQSKSS